MSDHRTIGRVETIHIAPQAAAAMDRGARETRMRLATCFALWLGLANGLIALNDDNRHRVVIIDPRTNRIVWQYGRTDRPSRAVGSLRVPDGIDFVPAGIFGGT